ncbi:MAG: hypothetical protein CL908_10730 [Deltaproteobacteria bacterium]|nr:hypothetical protein [Deltaproteobacteria bacterium]
MRRVVAQVALREGAPETERARVAGVLAACAGAKGPVSRSHAGVHHPGSVGGGDVTWDLLFVDDEAVREFCEQAGDVGAERLLDAIGLEAASVAPLVEFVIAAIPEPLGCEISQPGLTGVKRTLWLEVQPDAPEDLVREFEREMPCLANAVPAIRNWSWSRIRTAAPNPMTTRFTHLWEQEFETLDGLEVDYMSSPFHWGFFDRWFDPEMPDPIVDTRVGHLVCPATESVLSWESER